jgi:heat shock protein HtpX
MMHNYNAVKTTMVLASLRVWLVVIGCWLGGTGGMVWAIGLCVLMNGTAYWFSDTLALRMASAHEVTPQEAPELHRLIAGLAQRADLPMPRLYMVDSETPNAFATGRSPEHGAVAVTTGIMQLLHRDELAGVLAHELGHIKNRDTLISVVAAAVAGAITLLANMAQWALLFASGSGDEEDGTGHIVGGLCLLIVAPIAAALIRLAISRTREFGADTLGAQVSGDPIALASALRKLETWRTRQPLAVNPATAHLYIVNPLYGGRIAHLFSTHPPIEHRIARLERLALGHGS